MSEIMNTFFDRSRNDADTSGEQATAATTTQEAQEAQEVTDIDTIDEQTDADSPADDTLSTETAEDTADDDADAESTDDTEADDATEDDAADEDATEDDAAEDNAADEDAADDDAENTESDDDNADEAGDSTDVVDEDDEIADDAAPLTLVPATVEPSDAPAESDDAPAESGDAPADAETDAVDAETDAVEPAESDQAEPVLAAAKIEARPAAGLRGNTTVGDGVVSKVVNMVALKADGVHRLDDEDSSVTVDADIATIRIALVVEYGHAVKALAEQVRTDVIDAVEQFLGLDVAAVDVHVTDIHHPEAV